MKTVEKVCRALARVHEPLDGSKPTFVDDTWRDYVPEAFAVLGALGMEETILREEETPLS